MENKSGTVPSTGSARCWALMPFNKVDFDSVFNQSSHTFSFGSPDILPMFSRGAVPGRVRTWSYAEEDEDFTKGNLYDPNFALSFIFPLIDATALDIWVLDQLRTLLHNATADAILDSQLRCDKVVFFLHLLGLDTTGHSYRPHSKVGSSAFCFYSPFHANRICIGIHDQY
jgi:GPI ethanolamine phosphate transferase 1